MQPSPSAAAAEFAQVAKGFCDWCEAPALLAPADVLATTWLARLHAAALALPEAEPESDDGMPPLPEPAASRAKANLSVFNGFYYREYFNPDPRLSDESCTGDVGDDLADVYRDVRGGLLFYERGQLVEALWHWSFLHQGHWGRHAVGAMFALQCARSFRDEPYDGV